MAIIDVVKFGGDASTDICWKFPTDQVVWGSQLIVNESMEAIFFKGGKALDVFTAGTHTLKTGNIPLLEKLVNLPFGGDTPFSAEVWFVNKIAFNDLKWGTKTPIQVTDPKYGIGAPVRAFGQFGVRVIDSQFFVTELVGTAGKRTTDEATGFLKNRISRKLTDAIATMLKKGDMDSILDMSNQLNELSEFGKEEVKEDFAKYGLEIIEFDVMSLNFPEDDPSIQQLKAALADKAQMNILGEQYQQKRMLDIGMAAASNEGGGAGTMMGAGMGMGMGMGMGNMMGGMMGGMNPQMQQQGMMGGQQMMGQGQPQQQAVAPAPDPMAKLTQLKGMLDGGLISQEEFDKKKADLLANM